ncbi:MAG: hypothetical protein JWQ01_4963 [Massilia sp.]|jgi:hypothetical protein|nr:hypothetical protein [Massilia sp.]
MKTTLSKPSLMGLALIVAITLALMSVFIESTGPELVQYGNLCGAAALDPCYKPALKGGFPVAYLFDAPGSSRERQLAFGEDKLHVGALIADVAVNFAIFMAIAWVVSRRRSAVELDAE